MAATFRELCGLIENCTKRLQDEVKNSINQCHLDLVESDFENATIALEKAKDYHRKEIIKLISGIIINMKQIVFHEDKIRQINFKDKLSSEELKQYSNVESDGAKFVGDTVVRRKLRRATSEASLNCLDMWNAYLNKDDNMNNILSYSLPNVNMIPKPEIHINSKHKNQAQKHISSNHNNLLENDLITMKALQEETDEETENQKNETQIQYLSNDVNSEVMIAKMNNNYDQEKTRPKIVALQVRYY